MMRDNRIDVRASSVYHVGLHGTEEDSAEDTLRYPARDITVAAMDGRLDEEPHSILGPRLWLYGIRDELGGRIEVSIYFDGRVNVTRHKGKEEQVLFDYNPYEEEDNDSGNGEGTRDAGS
jgi:hypothetical protein